MTYIPATECKPGYLYKIRSRNLGLGVFRGAPVNGFIGIREKFDSLFLFTEYHYDTGGTLGTVQPEIELEPCPVEDLRETLGTKCQVCDRKAWFVEWSQDNPAPADDPYPGRGRWRCEGGCDDTKPIGVSNRELYDWLIEKECANSDSFREFYEAYKAGDEALDAYKTRNREEYWAGEKERVAQRKAQESGLTGTPPIR